MEKVNSAAPDPKVTAAISPTLSWPEVACTVSYANQPLWPHVDDNIVAPTSVGNSGAEVLTSDRVPRIPTGVCDTGSQPVIAADKCLGKKNSQSTSSRLEKSPVSPKESVDGKNKIFEHSSGIIGVDQVEVDGYHGAALALYSDELGCADIKQGKELFPDFRDLSPPGSNAVFSGDSENAKCFGPKTSLCQAQKRFWCMSEH